MQDRTIKFLLSAIALLLLCLLLRPLWQSAPVQAQGISLADARAQEQGRPLAAQGVPAVPGSPQMLVDNNYRSLYVMQNGKVYVYAREDDGKLRWVLWQVLSPGQDVPHRQM